MKNPKSFLLLPVCGLGDAVCYLPFVRAIRARFPDSEIVAIVATEAAKAIIEGTSQSLEVVVFNRSKQRGQMGLLRLLWELRRRRFDVVISGAHLNSIRVPLFAWFCGRKLRVGANTERLKFLYNRTVDVRAIAHSFERYRKLLTGVGIQVAPGDYRPRIEPPLVARNSALQLWKMEGLNEGERVVGIASGADPNLRAGWVPTLKRWGIEGYAEVARWAEREAHARVVMFGAPEEAPLATAIAKVSGVPVVNLCGRTSVLELQWMLRRCSVFVSNDTGNMHMASALGVPVLALFGPTSQESFGPIGDLSHVLQGKAHCSPCYPYPTCDLKECLAMDNISPRQVIESLSAMLSVQKGAALLPVSSLGISSMPTTTVESEI